MEEQDESWVAATASALLAAEYERVPINALTFRWPGLSLETTYRVQAAVVERRLAAGARVVGHKTGVAVLGLRSPRRPGSPAAPPVVPAATAPGTPPPPPGPPAA
ncbi:hypothetical protein ITI46_07780 [Streptomyces oryzae]|uniref:Uncharacterized protein n=1 Tax=Streptomyces oryzae TaxID=1434886 RepID=A0ABS3X884_9ACTN|nr:hypothetical protein [Streptomyces oryzae]MBO8191592.1 hypothetical protein [Streptomyces oryzae]